MESQYPILVLRTLINLDQQNSYLHNLFFVAQNKALIFPNPGFNFPKFPKTELPIPILQLNRPGPVRFGENMKGCLLVVDGTSIDRVVRWVFLFGVMGICREVVADLVGRSEGVREKESW